MFVLVKGIHFIDFVVEISRLPRDLIVLEVGTVIVLGFNSMLNSMHCAVIFSFESMKKIVCSTCTGILFWIMFSIFF